jgi:uncharacterized protein YciI
MPPADLPTAEELIPKAFDSHTVILLRWADDQPVLSEAESDELFVAHLAYLRDRMVEGVLLANGPLRDQTDERLRGLSVYALPLEEALAVARRDPMVLAGWFAIEGANWMLARGNARFGNTTVDSATARSSIE